MQTTNRKAVKGPSSVAWYEQVWDLVAGNNNRDDLIANADKTGIIRYFVVNILPFISPMILLIPLAGTWNKLKNFSQEKNWNYEKVLDLSINLTTTLASLTLFGLVWGGLSYLAPYFLASMLAVAFGYAAFNLVKFAVRAISAHVKGDLEDRNENLVAMPRQIFTLLVSSLGFVTHLAYSFNYSQIAGVFDYVVAGIGHYPMVTAAFYGVGALITLTTLPALINKAMKLNTETANMVMNPFQTLDTFLANKAKKINAVFDFTFKNPLRATLLFIPATIAIAAETISSIIRGLSHVAALIIAPVQLMHAAAYWFATPSIPVIPPVVKTTEETNSTAHIIENMKTKLNVLIKGEIKHLESAVKTNPDDNTHLAKLCYVRQVERKFGADAEDISLADTEVACKLISPNLYQSFWRKKGHVEEISDLATALENKIKAIIPSI
jgi:hypothetical protein